MRPFLVVPIFILSSCLSLPGLGPTPSRAQMALPGAVSAPTQEGQAGAPPATAAPKRRASGSAPANPAGAIIFDKHFVAARPPSVDSIIGRPFSLGGSRGGLQVEKSGSDKNADLRLSRLTLVGEKISHPNQICEVSMAGDGPLGLKPLGTPDGVQRFELASSACPLQFDALNGALLASSPSGACNFAAADCRVDATGLWGPAGDAFSPSQIKTMERDRASLESSLRSHFRTLLHRTGKDRPLAKATVREQAGFAASRSQACRDYDREETHGFCSLRLTEAHDYRLQARLQEAAAAKEKTKGQARTRQGEGAWQGGQAAGRRRPGAGARPDRGQIGSQARSDAF